MDSLILSYLIWEGSALLFDDEIRMSHDRGALLRAVKRYSLLANTDVLRRPFFYSGTCRHAYQLKLRHLSTSKVVDQGFHGL